MKLTKQKIWFIIQIAIAAFLIINGCQTPVTTTIVSKFLI